MRKFETGGHYPIPLADLPRSWAVTYVGDVVWDIQSGFPSGKHNQEGRGIPHLRPMNIDRNGEVDLSVVKYVPDSKALRLRRGDVLFNNTNSAELIGKTATVTVDGEFAFSNHMTRLRPAEGVVSKFVSLQLHYLWMTGYFRHRCTHHVNQASVSSKPLAETVPFVVAPSAEQQRIVAEIEKQFTRLDAAVAALKRVQANLKRYRAAVLKAACEGRLVPTAAELARAEGRGYEPADKLLARILEERRARWEADQLAKMKAKGKPPKDDKWKAKYKEPTPPDRSGLPPLPDGWVWASLDFLLTGIEAGKSFKCEERPPIGSEIGVVKVSAVSWGMFQELESKTCTREARVNAAYLIQDGDFLFSRANTIDLVGACVIVNRVSLRLMLSDKILRFRLVEIPKKWILHALRSCFGRDEIERLATGNQESMRNIGQDRIRQIRIPLPPERELARIVERLERDLSTIDELSVIVRENLKRADGLRQSILKQAFEGKLVPQDPADEPASALLERIRAERDQPAQRTLPRVPARRLASR